MASSCCWSMSTVHSALPTIKAPPSLSLVGYKPKKQCKGLFMLSHSDINPSGSNRVSAKTSTMPSFSNLLPFNTLLSTSGLFSGVDMGCKWFMMRHGRKVPKLNRPADQRKALLRGLTTQLLRHGRIKTTRARAKAMRKWVDKMITLAKNGTLHHRRQALAYIYDKQLVHAMFEEVGERYGERNGGYTRITRTWSRRGDNAPMAYIELV